MGKLSGKKILMIIAKDQFRDEEYDEPRKIFESEGASITVASSSLNKSKGMLGMVAQPDVLISDVKAQDYDAIIFVGGYGSSEYWDNPTAHKIAKEAYSAGKVVCAICIAPVTLARAGLLKGKKATVYPSEIDKIKAGGAIYGGADVEKDGKIVTASGPAVASQFGKKVVEAILE
jgi:protease I